MLALYLFICFSSAVYVSSLNHTGRDSDTMLPLYMQDEMYRKSLLLVTDENGYWEFDRGAATVVNYIFTIGGLEEHITGPNEKLCRHIMKVCQERISWDLRLLTNGKTHACLAPPTINECGEEAPEDAWDRSSCKCLYEVSAQTVSQVTDSPSTTSQWYVGDSLVAIDRS